MQDNEGRQEAGVDLGGVSVAKPLPVPRVYSDGERWVVLGNREPCPQCPPSFTKETLVLNRENAVVQCEACGWTSEEASGEVARYLLATHDLIGSATGWQRDLPSTLSEWVTGLVVAKQDGDRAAEKMGKQIDSLVGEVSKLTDRLAESEDHLTKPKSETKSHARKKPASEGDDKKESAPDA